jgi:hypothetical protein
LGLISAHPRIIRHDILSRAAPYHGPLGAVTPQPYLEKRGFDMYYLRQTCTRPFTGIRETDILDYYLPSPLVPHTGGTQATHVRALPIRLPTWRLMRRGRD